VSKKDNLKFKKRIKSQILQEISRSQVNAPKNIPTFVKPAVFSAPSLIPDKKFEVNIPLDKIANNFELVRSDLKKSAIIIGSIIVLIIAIYFIDSKTGFLLKASDQLFRTLHLSA